MFKKYYNNGGKHIMFFLLFNLVFLAFGFTLKYALPFVISGLLAVWIKPLADFISKKTKLNKAFVNISCILTALTLIISGLYLIASGILSESSTILSEISKVNLDFIYDKMIVAKEYIETLSPEILSNIAAYIQSLISQVGSIVGTVGNYLLKVAGLIPGVVIAIIITIMSAYYILRDFEQIKASFLSIKIANSDLPSKMLLRANSIIINYIQSYGILLVITFVECMITFKMLDVKYMFTLSIACVVLDILPIVGSAMIYLPLAGMFFLQGKTVTAVVLIVLYAIFVIIRNIIEPKLLSKTLAIHPLMILISIYVGVSIAGILGVIYCIFLIAYFKILKEMELL